MEFLVIDNQDRVREATCILMAEEGLSAEGAASGRAGLNRLGARKFDAVVLEAVLESENGLDVLREIAQREPGLPVIVLTSVGNVRVAVEAMRRGATDFLEKPLRREQLHQLVARLRSQARSGRGLAGMARRGPDTRAPAMEPIFDFATPAMCDVMDLLRRAASTPASVLILGDSGTGKSVIARAIHDLSDFAAQPFVTVSCPSLSRELLESELFGHVKGAFTGALKDHWGKVHAAEGGTLFLDEIGDLPMEIQPKLLRLLQEREYERLGENVTRQATVRIVAATNRDLKARVAAGEFREDLFFRLNVVALEIPRLKDRPLDLMRLAGHYLNFFAAQCGRTVHSFSPEATARMCAYNWPGNLRELRNAIERAVIMTHDQRIVPADLPPEVQGVEAGVKDDVAQAATARVGSRISLDRIEEFHIRRVLEQTHSFVEAAAVLGIDQATLYRKRKKWTKEEPPRDPDSS